MPKSGPYSPATVNEAWLNLATDVLIFAINDVRQNPDPNKRSRAKYFLLSPAAQLLFDVVIYPQFDVHEWVMADCPILETNERSDKPTEART